ncbi:MAG TPA: tetratricopeptide repeat protein [Opitutaceae bacterium]|nr:tetratricopeptide repeat protein [Opitutaceae bacterium]
MNSAESAGSTSLPWRRVLLVVGLLAVAALAGYRNTLTAPFVLDDGGTITDNPTIHHLWSAMVPPRGGYTVSGRPVANLSFALNYAISGQSVWSYHLLNLAIHFLAACTLFGVVRRTLAGPVLRARFGRVALPLAGFSAVLWLLHPLQTEAVTYVSQRVESLMALFFLLTFYGFVRSIDSPRPRVWRALALLACLLGVGTKEVIATAPVLLLLYDRTFVAGTFRGAWAARRGFYLLLAATWLPLAALVAGTGWDRGGTAGFDVGVTPSAYWCTQFEALVRYLRMSVWPHPQIFDYGTFWYGLGAAAPYALVIAVLAAATLVALWRWPSAGFVGAWFFAILAPTSLVPGTIQMIVEHRMYLPLAALVAFSVAGAYALLGRRSLWLWPALAVAAGALTFQRNEVYRSDLALWRDTVAKVPDNARARYSLGIAFTERGRYAEAVEQGKEALRVDTRGAYRSKAFMVQNKLGHDLVMLGKTDEAVPHFEAALRQDPIYGIAHLNLARALVSLNRYPEAIRHYEAALQRHIGGAEAEEELGDALMHEGRTADAVGHLQAALRLAPGSAPGLNNLGYALLMTGHVDAAVAAYRQAVQLNPQYVAAWVGLGYALITAGRPAEAVGPCTTAVTLRPEFADAHNVLGIALARSGRSNEAIAAFEQALRFGGRGPDVYNNLGNALAAVGRRTEAVARYREALQVDPDYAPAQRNLGEELQRSGDPTEAAGPRRKEPR